MRGKQKDIPFKEFPALLSTPVVRGSCRWDPRPGTGSVTDQVKEGADFMKGAF